MVLKLTPAEFLERRRADPSWAMLDVREPWEVEVAAIPESLHIPMSAIASRLDELDAGRPLAVVCHSGVRSLRVAEFLEQQGFAEVANIEGGIDAWSLEIDDTVPRY